MALFFRDKLPVGIKKLLLPRKEFSANLRSVFLAGFERSSAAPLGSHWSLVGRILVASVVLFAATSGVAVYADSQNVSPQHPLYLMKRYSEFMQSFAASPEDQPALHLKFAARRLSEIESLEGEGEKEEPSIATAVKVTVTATPTAATGAISTAKPVNARVGKLYNDLNDEIRTSINNVGAEKQSSKRANICKSLDKFMNYGAPPVKKVVKEHPKMKNQFESQCAGYLESD